MKDHKVTVVVNKTTQAITLIVITVLILSGCNSTNALKKDLYSKAQTEMLDYLKVPSTAIFSTDFEVKKFVLKKDPDNIMNLCGIEVPIDEELPEKYANEKYEPYHEVYFWTDAENSYGAMLRTDYTCLIDEFDNILCQTTEDASYIKDTICS